MGGPDDPACHRIRRHVHRPHPRRRTMGHRVSCPRCRDRRHHADDRIGGLTRPGLPFRGVNTVAVIYVGDLARIRRFYEACFGWSLVDEGHRYCGLRSHAGLVTLVETADARVETSSAPRRSVSAIKLVVEVDSIDDAIAAVVAAGGRIDSADHAWTFRGRRHHDVIDPEGNVLQLLETAP